MSTPVKPPIVIVGMHRSGTSITTKSLRAMGLFTGLRTDKNGESTFYQRLNRQLSSEAGGHWTNPLAVTESLSKVQDLNTFVQPLHQHLDGYSALEYWGVHCIKGKSYGGHWGWKDPRNGYLLAVWRAVYPDLKIVWVRRDPRACAISLHTRTGALRTAATEHRTGSSLRSIGAQLRGRPLLASGWRALDLGSALDLCLTYAELHQQTLVGIDAGVHRVDYEELIDSPTAVLRRCADFAGLSVTNEQVERAAEEVVASPNRGSSDAMSELEPKFGDRLRALGY